MEIAPAFSTTTKETQETTVTNSLGGVEGLGQDTFLRLLITQLQNQDPLNPTSNEEFIAQLAQFTALEQTTKINTLLEDLIAQGQQQVDVNLVSLIGHEVVADGNTVQVGEIGSVNLVYELNGNATAGTIRVFDALGNLVRTLPLGAAPSGLQTAVWDGIDEAGNRVPTGTYQFQVEALDVKGNQVPTTTFLRDVVRSVTLDKEQTELILGSGIRLASSDVVAVQ